MKLARFLQPEPSWGVLDTDAGEIQPVGGGTEDWGPALARGEDTLERVGTPMPLSAAHLVAPLERTATVFGVGMNYWSHLERLGITERPATTIAYIKPQGAIVGPDQEIRYPETTQQLDYEVELVAVIGSAPVDRHHGSGDVMGYTIGNDISARDARLPLPGTSTAPVPGIDLFSMKALGQSSPIGPWITTKDELPGNGQIDVEITLRVNGEVRQHDRTTNMLWTVDEVLAYLVARTPLASGDLVFTGTTCGVGMEDGRFLQPGDVVEAEISGIGFLRNTVGRRARDSE